MVENISPVEAGQPAGSNSFKDTLTKTCGQEPIRIKLTEAGVYTSPGLVDIEKFRKTVQVVSGTNNKQESPQPLTDYLADNSKELVRMTLEAQLQDMPPALKKTALNDRKQMLADLGLEGKFAGDKLILTPIKVDGNPTSQEIQKNDWLLKRFMLTLSSLSKDIPAYEESFKLSSGNRDQISTRLIQNLVQNEKSPFGRLQRILDISGRKGDLRHDVFLQGLRQGVAESYQNWIEARKKGMGEELEKQRKLSDVLSLRLTERLTGPAKTIAQEISTDFDNDLETTLSGEKTIINPETKKVESVFLLDTVMARYADIYLPPQFFVEEQQLEQTRSSLAGKAENNEQILEINRQIREKRQMSRLALIESRGVNIDSYFADDETKNYVQELRTKPEYSKLVKEIALRRKNLKKDSLVLANIQGKLLRDFVSQVIPADKNMGAEDKAKRDKLIEYLPSCLDVPQGMSIKEIYSRQDLTNEQKDFIAQMLEGKTIGLDGILNSLTDDKDKINLIKKYFAKKQNVHIQEMSSEEKWQKGFTPQMSERDVPVFMRADKINADVARERGIDTYEDPALKGLAYLLKAQSERALPEEERLKQGYVVRVDVPRNEAGEIPPGIGTSLRLESVKERKQPKITVVHTEQGLRYVEEGAIAEEKQVIPNTSGEKKLPYIQTGTTARATLESVAVQVPPAVESPTQVTQPVPPEAPQQPPAQPGIAPVEQIPSVPPVVVASETPTQVTQPVPPEAPQQPPAQGEQAPPVVETPVEVTALQPLTQNEKDLAELTIRGINSTYDETMQFAQGKNGKILVDRVTTAIRYQVESGKLVDEKVVDVAEALLFNVTAGTDMTAALAKHNINLIDIRKAIDAAKKPTVEVLEQVDQIIKPKDTVVTTATGYKAEMRDGKLYLTPPGPNGKENLLKYGSIDEAVKNISIGIKIAGESIKPILASYSEALRQLNVEIAGNEFLDSVDTELKTLGLVDRNLFHKDFGEGHLFLQLNNADLTLSPEGTMALETLNKRLKETGTTLYVENMDISVNQNDATIDLGQYAITSLTVRESSIKNLALVLGPDVTNLTIKENSRVKISDPNNVDFVNIDSITLDSGAFLYLDQTMIDKLKNKQVKLNLNNASFLLGTEDQKDNYQGEGDYLIISEPGEVPHIQKLVAPSTTMPTPPTAVTPTPSQPVPSEEVVAPSKTEIQPDTLPLQEEANKEQNNGPFNISSEVEETERKGLEVPDWLKNLRGNIRGFKLPQVRLPSLKRKPKVTAAPPSFNPPETNNVTVEDQVIETPAFFTDDAGVKDDDM